LQSERYEYYFIVSLLGNISFQALLKRERTAR
jgi:hypothetical protein